MPGPNIPYTRLDYQQVLKQVFDETNDRLRVDAAVSATISSIDIDALVSDIAIKDRITGYLLKVNADGSIDANVRVDAASDTIKSWTQDGYGNPITSVTSNSNRLLHIQTPDNASSAFTLGVLNANGTISLAGLTSVGFQLNNGTFRGTILAQASVDGGTTWTTIPFYDPVNSSVLTQLTFTSNNTQKIVSVIPIGGSSDVRVIVSEYTSGSATGLLRASTTASSAGAITASAFNVVVNTNVFIPSNTVTLLLQSNVNRKYTYFSNLSGSSVNVQFGNSTGLNATTGLIIPTNEKYELKGDNLFTGNVYAYSATAITISVAEGTPQ